MSVLRRVTSLAGTALAATALAALPALPAVAAQGAPAAPANRVVVTAHFFLVDANGSVRNSAQALYYYHQSLNASHPSDTSPEYKPVGCAGGHVHAKAFTTATQSATGDGGVTVTPVVSLYEGATCATATQTLQVKGAPVSVPLGQSVTSGLTQVADAEGDAVYAYLVVTNQAA